MVRTTIDAMQGNKLIIHQHRSIAGHNLFRFIRARLYGLLVLMVCLLGSIEGLGQTSNGFLDFGTTANGTTATTVNTGFGGVRVGTGGGGFTIQNPGQTIGTVAELKGIAPTGASINSVAITSAEYGTAATTFTVSFEIHLTGGASGNWYFFAGNGTSFGSAQSSGFAGADVFTGIRWTFGSSSTITTDNRAAGSWATVSGTPFAQNTSYYVTIIGNNSSSSVSYGASNAYSVAAYTYDLWVNGSLAGDDLGKAQIANSTSINAFRFYGENSTSNVATIALDNIRWYNTCVLPPTHLVQMSIPATGLVNSNIGTYTVEVRSGSTAGPVANLYSGQITVAKTTGPGNISGTLSPNATNGVATYSNTQFDAGGSYTITSSAPSPIVSSSASGNIVISPSTYSITYNANSGTGSQTDASSPYNSGSTVTVLGAGSIARLGYTFSGWNTASDGSGTAYAPGATFTIGANTTLYAQWTVACTSQTISGLPATDTKTYGDASYALTATSSSGLTVSYSSSNTAVATVSGSNVTIVGAGTTTITASQSGNGTYCAASNITQTLTINKKNLTITGLNANDKTFDGTIAATLSGTATLSGVLPADAGNVTLVGPPSATFADASVGTNKPVSVTGYTITGSAAANYTISQPSGLTADITAAANSIDLSPATQAKGPYCNGSANSIALTYTTSGTVTAPLFIQLSNSSGTFISGTTDLGGTVTGSGPYTITAFIPAGTTAGNNYRVRILSSDATPVSSTNNASDIVITAAVTPAVTIAASPSNAICSGTSVTFTPTPANGGTPTYTWWKNGIGTGTSLGTGATLTTSTLANGDVVAAVMTSTISCVSSTSANSNNISMLVTPTVTPAVSIAITTGTNPTCTGNFTFTATPTNGGASPSYQWKNGAANVGTNATTYSPAGLADGSAISVVITSNAACASSTTATSNTINITNNLPAQPSAITGSSNVYQTQTSVSYSVANTAGVTYTWSYSGTGATITAGQGTNTISVDFASSATAGTLTVTPSKAGCTGTANTLSISVAPSNDLCSNATTLSLNAATGGTVANATATSGATSYAPTKNDVWYKFVPACTGSHTITINFTTGPDLDFDLFASNCPSASATGIITGHSTNTTTETNSGTLTGGTTYYLRIVDYNGNGSNFTVQVTGTTTVPAIPGTITQPAAPICASSTGKTFSIASVSGATSYTWSATGTGWSVTAGGTTTSATVTIGTAAGTVSVTANNGCGSSTAQTTGSISPIALPADPSGSITPAANPACTNTSLSYSAPAASIYWQTTSTGTNTASVSTAPLSISGSGTYYVRSYNGNCWSTNSTASAAITVNTQAAITTQPTYKSVTSPAGTSFSVTATNATSYQWQEDAGSGWTNITNGGIYSGATTATLTLSATAETMDGNGYRVLVGATSPCVTVTSNAVSLAVAPGPCLSEGFNNGTTTPSGWTFTNIGGTYTGSGNYGASSPSLQMDATGDIITTAALASGAAELSFWIKGQGTNSGSALLVEGWNGTSWVTIQNITNSIPTSGTTYTYNSGTSPALPTGLTQFRFTYSKNAGNLAIDDVVVSCTQTCTSSAIITSFLPASGPVGTWVTITGTGFTGATDVKFGGVSASSFTVVNSTTIKAKVPTAAINGNISVTVGGCAAATSSSFTLISQTSCSSSGGSATDLFISEVYDAVSGSLGYIEIFNGTGSTVTLTNYTIRIRTGTSTDNDFPMSGTLASGAVYILRVGTSSSGNCSGFTIHDNQSTASGFNGNDQIFLLKNGSVIDYAPNPNATGAGGSNANAPGFSQVRKNTVTAPSTSYIASQWTNSSVESCSDLGVAPYVPGGNSVTVTGPSDYTLCTVPVSFSATVNGTGPNSPTYLWKVYNPLTNAWVDASTLSTVSGFGLYSSISTSATNTTAMSVTGNVAQLQNYQFYLQVTRGSCIAASAAAQYLYETRPYYRSNVASGNWSAPGSWQMSNDKATWVSACSYPIALNSDEVEIQTGHVIALDLDADIDKVTINASTGQLTINNTSKLTILNGNTGADLIVNGILQDDGSTANGIDYATNASWTLGSAGKIIKTNGGSSKYRDNYETGIANIPATASWIYRIATASPTLFVASGSSSTTMYYPHLTIENTTVGNFSSSITASPDLSQFAFIGSNNGVIVKGDLNVGGSLANAGTVSFSNINSYAPLQVLGNTTIISGNTLNNTGNASAAGGGFEFQGNLVNNGTLRSKLYAANGTSGKLWFTGGNNQTISGSGVFDLHNFRVNKTGSSTLILTTDVLVPDSLTLVNGIVYTNASPSGLLTLGTTTNVVYGSPGTAAYINGPLAKQFAVGANTEFLYPVGKPLGYPTAYNPCYVVPTNITGATTTFTSEYFAGPNEAQGVMGGSVLGITNKEYWNINKSPSNTSTARVKLYYDNPGSANWIYYTGASVSPFYTNAVPPCWYCNVAVVHKEATTWNFTKTSNFNATDPEYKYYATDGWIYSKAIDNFSPFTLAYSYNMILPVKLLAFTGRLINTDGLLEWSIADARDLDGFELEYSTDGSSYQSLAKIGSNGSTRYSFLHKKLPAGTNYYRMRVKEKGGNQYYSQVVMLNMGKLKTYVIGLAPTVVGTQLTTAIFAANAQKLQARITDVLGRQLWTGSKNLAAGTNQWNIDTHDLPKGLYFISLETPDGLKETLRFIKE